MSTDNGELQTTDEPVVNLPQLPDNQGELDTWMWELKSRGMSLRQIGQIVKLSHEQVRQRLQIHQRTAFEDVVGASVEEIAGDQFLFFKGMREQFMRLASTCTDTSPMRYNHLRAAMEANEKLLKLYQEQGILSKITESQSELERRLARMSKTELESRKAEILSELDAAEDAA